MRLIKIVFPPMLVVAAICIAMEALSLGTGQEWLMTSL